MYRSGEGSPGHKAVTQGYKRDAEQIIFVNKLIITILLAGTDLVGSFIHDSESRNAALGKVTIQNVI